MHRSVFHRSQRCPGFATVKLAGIKTPSVSNSELPGCLTTEVKTCVRRPVADMTSEYSTEQNRRHPLMGHYQSESCFKPCINDTLYIVSCYELFDWQLLDPKDLSTPGTLESTLPPPQLKLILVFRTGYNQISLPPQIFSATPSTLRIGKKKRANYPHFVDKVGP